MTTGQFQLFGSAKRAPKPLPQPITPSPVVRTRDPWSSQQAAARALGDVERSSGWVWEIMQDGIPRTDEEIVETCAAKGYHASPQRIRYGRLQLASAGLLVETAAVRRTERGCRCREWVRREAAP